MTICQGEASDVLVVDDNPADRRFIEEALRASQLDLVIRTVKTRDEALDSLNQRDEYETVPEPDAVLVDWNLAGCTGEAVVKAAKSIDPDIFVVVMTGSESELHNVKSTLSQGDIYMEKPTEPDGYIEPLHSLQNEQ